MRRSFVFATVGLRFYDKMAGREAGCKRFGKELGSLSFYLF
jgi:hypothetical protein